MRRERTNLFPCRKTKFCDTLSVAFSRTAYILQFISYPLHDGVLPLR